MGWWVVICAVSAGAAAVVAIGVVGYAIYKTCKPHKTSGGGGGSNDQIQEMVTIDDIKPQSREVDSGLRHRNVNSDHTNSKKDKETVMPVAAAAHVITISRKESQETQTCDFLDSLNVLPGNEVTFNLNDDTCSQSSVTTIGSESVFSIASSTSTVTSDRLNDCRIPRWNEMSDGEKCESLCNACSGENPVLTIGVPCEHPYMCDECAPILFKQYKKCPLCGIKMSSYRKI